MSQIWMGTCAMNERIEVQCWNFHYLIERRITKRELRIMLDSNDCHKWCIGFEVGKDGFRHYQIRLVSSSDGFFEWLKAHIPVAHIEKSDTEWSDYERKGGRFISSRDTTEVRQIRFGAPNQVQKAVLRDLKLQGDREIDVWYDPKGNSGKTWLCTHLWEIGQAHIIMCYGDAKTIIKDACSKFEKDMRPIAIVDMKRAGKWEDDMYLCLETLKDGLLDDPRYSSTTINIRGVKVLVCTNSKIEIPKLSYDRWIINGTKLPGQKFQSQMRNKCLSP